MLMTEKTFLTSSKILHYSNESEKYYPSRRKIVHEWYSKQFGDLGNCSDMQGSVRATNANPTTQGCENMIYIYVYEKINVRKFTEYVQSNLWLSFHVL